MNPTHSDRRLNRLRRTRPRGFSLVEVLVSLFVIVVGVLPLLILLLSSRRLDDQAQVQAAAYQAARQEMEALGARSDRDRLATTRTAFSLPSALIARFPRQTLTGTYSVTNVSTLGDVSYPVQQVVVRVSWADADAPGRPTSHVQLDTYFSRGAGQ